MAGIPDKLRYKLSRRREGNALRELPVNRKLADFSSNDYLGFAANERIYSGASRLLEKYSSLPNGATGSRLLTGNHPLFAKAEQLLCDFHKCEDALIFNSGYDANLGFFSSVPQREDVVFYDEYVHASIRDGLVLGLAKNYKFRHNDLEHLQEVILRSLYRDQGSRSGEIYIVTESVFSMDGDTPDLRTLVHLCTTHGYRLVVDEAHAVGIAGKMGEGIVQDLGLSQDVFARIITFGKAVGCHGAAILGSAELKLYLINFCRTFIFSTALPPHSIASIISAYNLMNSDVGTELRNALIDNILYFNRFAAEQDIHTHFLSGNSPIRCCLIPGIVQVKRVSTILKIAGHEVKPILSPTVPQGRERLRFCIHATNTQEEIEAVLTTLKSEMSTSAAE